MDKAVKGFATDMHNHLIRLVGLQAHLQELMTEPLKHFVGVQGSKKRSSGVISKPKVTAYPSTTGSADFVKRAQTMRYPTLYFILSSFLLFSYSEIKARREEKEKEDKQRMQRQFEEARNVKLAGASRSFPFVRNSTI